MRFLYSCRTLCKVRESSSRSLQKSKRVSAPSNFLLRTLPASFPKRAIFGAISLSQSFNSTIFPISGKVFLAHCSAALFATRAQRSIFEASRFTPGRAIVWSEISGTILSAPSSVAFSTMSSNLFCFGRQSARVMCLEKTFSPFVSGSSDSSKFSSVLISPTHFALIESFPKSTSSMSALLPFLSTATMRSPFLARRE